MSSDAIRNAFERLMDKVGINGHRGFYALRKTGATLIEKIDPAVTEMYLAHAEPGMKRAYAQRDWGRLAQALEAMAERLKDALTT
jgi:integrase